MLFSPPPFFFLSFFLAPPFAPPPPLFSSSLSQSLLLPICLWREKNILPSSLSLLFLFFNSPRPFLSSSSSSAHPTTHVGTIHDHRAHFITQRPLRAPKTKCMVNNSGGMEPDDTLASVRTCLVHLMHQCARPFLLLLLLQLWLWVVPRPILLLFLFLLLLCGLGKGLLTPEEEIRRRSCFAFVAPGGFFGEPSLPLRTKWGGEGLTRFSVRESGVRSSNSNLTVVSLRRSRDSTPPVCKSLIRKLRKGKRRWGLEFRIWSNYGICHSTLPYLQVGLSLKRRRAAHLATIQSSNEIHPQKGSDSTAWAIRNTLARIGFHKKAPRDLKRPIPDTTR